MGLAEIVRAALGRWPDREPAGDGTPQVTVEYDPSTASDATAAAVETERVETRGARPVESIDGIGPAYAERLRAAGVETVADLAGADPAALAGEVDLSSTRLERWTEAARER